MFIEKEAALQYVCATAVTSGKVNINACLTGEQNIHFFTPSFLAILNLRHIAAVVRYQNLKIDFEIIH